MSSWGRWVRVVGVLALCAGAVLPLHAQYTVGRVAGTVMDSSGAVIAGATVTLRHTGTNDVRRFVTENDGFFAFVALPPGGYQIRAEAPKFVTQVLKLHVLTNETITQNFTLNVGSPPEKIAVVESRENVDLADAQRATTRTSLELSSLPSPGRNMINLVTLAPGVQPTNNPRGGSTFGGGGSYVIALGVQSGLIAANGGRARASSVQLDYTDANDWEGGGFAPGMQAITPDMLEEFKLLTSNFSAEYGVKSNAQIMMVTKSGSNHWHGSAYDFVQNDALNARDYFDTTGKPTPFKSNIYGVTMGGPVRTDRTFFFAGYEGRKVRGGGFTTLATVPSDAARALATDPTIIGLMNRFLPRATGPVPTNPLLGTVAEQIPSPIDSYQLVLKADHHVGERHLLSARYLQSTASFVARFASLNSLPGFDVDNRFALRNVNLSDTYTPGDRTVNELRLAYGRAAALGDPQNGLDSPRFVIPQVVNFGALQSVPKARTFNVYQVNDVLSHIRGSHIFKIGADVRQIQDNSLNATNSRGVFTFASLGSFLNEQPTSWTQLFGSTSRGFRTGLYGLFVQDDWKLKPTFTLNLGLRWEVQGALSEANDLSSVLDPQTPGAIGGAGTGLLGSFRIGGEAVHPNLRNVAPRLGFAWNPRGGNLVVRGGYGIYWDSFTFQPLDQARFVPPFDYTPTLSCATAGTPGCQITGANSFANLVAGTAAVQLASQGRVGSFGSLTNLGSITTVDPHLTNPYVQNFSLGTEYRFSSSLVGSLSYVGTKGTHLTRFVPINPALQVAAPAASTADEIARMGQFANLLQAENGCPLSSNKLAGPGICLGLSGLPGITNVRFDPRFDQVNEQESGGGSIYLSLQAELRKRFSGGLQFQASYTWSKSIDDASDFAPSIQANDASFAQIASNLRAERAVSNYDIPHRIVVTGIWQVPFFHSFKGVGGKVLDGWSFESVNMWQSGVPATLLAGTRTIVDPSKLVKPGGCNANPGACLTATDVNLDGNVVPGGSDNTRANCAPGAQFVLGNTAETGGFSQPLLGHNGTCGRNSVRMSSLTNFDWSFLKNFTLTERGPFGSGPWNLQFRAEFYNIFNLPFKTATTDAWRSVSSSSFGQFNTAGITRRVQLALRMTW